MMFGLRRNSVAATGLALWSFLLISWADEERCFSRRAAPVAQAKQPAPRIVITFVSADEGIIRGEVLNLPGPVNQFRVRALVRSDIVYPHPDETTVAEIDAKGNWELPHIPRGQERELFAILVPASFKMPAQIRALEDLPGVLAATGLRYQREFKGVSKPKPRRVRFANRTFRVRNETGGPGPNHFSDDETNVFLRNGQLHLRITQHGKETHCAEVVLDEELGFGHYEFVFAGKFSRDHFDDSAVLGIFLYGQNDAEELDLEISRWNKPGNLPAQWVLQPPPYTKNTLHRFDIGKAEVLTASLLWSQAKVAGRCWDNDGTRGQHLLSDWSYEGPKIPTKGLRVHMNLWAYQGTPGPKIAGTEVVIRDFRFRPLTQADQ